MAILSLLTKPAQSGKTATLLGEFANLNIFKSIL